MPRRTNAQIAADNERDRLAATGATTIERERNGTWWCPLCGHSQMNPVGTCGGCGAVRDGDHVVPAEAP